MIFQTRQEFYTTFAFDLQVKNFDRFRGFPYYMLYDKKAHRIDIMHELNLACMRIDDLIYNGKRYWVYGITTPTEEQKLLIKMAL